MNIYKVDRMVTWLLYTQAPSTLINTSHVYLTQHKLNSQYLHSHVCTIFIQVNFNHKTKHSIQDKHLRIILKKEQEILELLHFHLISLFELAMSIKNGL